MQEKKNDKKIANKFIKEKVKSLVSYILNILKTDTALKVGIEIKKEIFAESTLLNFKNRPAVIVIPALLTPGIKDKI